MFSDVILLHGQTQNSSPPTSSTNLLSTNVNIDKKNVCSSEKTTQAGNTQLSLYSRFCSLSNHKMDINFLDVMHICDTIHNKGCKLQITHEFVVPQVPNCFTTRVLCYTLPTTHLLTQRLFCWYVFLMEMYDFSTKACVFYKSCDSFTGHNGNFILIAGAFLVAVAKDNFSLERYRYFVILHCTLLSILISLLLLHL